MKRYLLFVLLAFSSPAILFSAAAALAQCPSTITVSSYNDSGSGTLRDALAKICSPGEIDIPAPGTNSIPPGAKITLSTVGDYTFGPSALAIPAAQVVTIKALGNGVVIQRDATVANLRLFYVAPTATVTLNNVTLQGGKAQGGYGGDQSGGTQGSGGGGAAGLGGAIFNEGTLTLNGVTLSGNTAQGGAGGATNGGGLGGGGGGGLGGNGGAAVFGGGGGGGNQGNGGNGGFCNGTVASGGATTGGDGGQACGAQSGADGGQGGGGGGGAYALGGNGNGGNGGFGAGGGGSTGGRGSIGLASGGSGGFGGGGGGGKSGVASSDFGGGNGGNCGSNLNGGFCGGNGGGGAGLGGALFNNLGTLGIANSTLTANSANGGAATSAAAAGQVSPTSGSGFGGAIFNRSGTVTTDNVTIAGNTVSGAAGAGGGIYNYQDPAESPATATFSLNNSLLATTTGGTNCTNDGGTLSDASHNLDDGTSCGFLSGNGSLSSAAPNLQPLANNGGPTNTMALGANSPAINGGESSVCSNAPVNGIDQRGLPRRSGFCDIGAFEVQPARISVYSGSPQSANVNTAFALPLKTLVVDGSSDPLGGVAVSYTAPGSGASATLSSGSASTDGTGIASVTATANGSPGSYNVVAKDPLAHTVNFQLTNRPPIQATVSPASINFGDVQVDTRVQKIITLKNTGGAPLIISNIQLVNAGGPPDFATVFTLTNNCPSSLPAGKSCKITVTLFDNQPETLSTSVDITDNAADSPQHVPLSANVTEVDIGFKPASLSFAPIAVGSPEKKTETITNLSNATMTLNSIVFTGTNAADFSQTNNCPAPMQPNASCKATITFTPGGTGSRVAGMMVTANSGSTIQTLPLSGTGN